VLAGQTVEVVCDGWLVHISHEGVLIATHASRHAEQQQAWLRRKTTPAVAPKPAAARR